MYSGISLNILPEQEEYLVEHHILHSFHQLWKYTVMLLLEHSPKTRLIEHKNKNGISMRHKPNQ